MLRVPTDKEGEIVSLKFFRNKADHVELLRMLVVASERDNDLRNFPLPCTFERERMDGPGRDGVIPIFRIRFEVKMIRALNPEGR